MYQGAKTTEEGPFIAHVGVAVEKIEDDAKGCGALELRRSKLAEIDVEVVLRKYQEHVDTLNEAAKFSSKQTSAMQNMCRYCLI